MYRKSLTITIISALTMLFASGTLAADAEMNMFGGEAYLGQPNLELTAALVRAGGGAEDFSTAKALTAMLGAKTVKAEVGKLNKQYGKDKVQSFLEGEDAVVADALKHAKDMGITLPDAPADLKGTKLAAALVKAGLTSDNTFWSGHFYDMLVSHDIHNAVMADVNQNSDLGPGYDRMVHMIGNQAFYDIAHALGHEDVQLAQLH